MNTVVILYSRLAGYFVNNINTFLNEFTNFRAVIIAYPSSKDAPYEFDFHDRIHIAYKQNSHLLSSIIDDSTVKMILCSGWFDKDYLKICKQYKKKGVPVICSLDNHWEGTLRQHLASLLSSFFVRKYFNYAWVPGLWQYEFARRLGFPPTNIKLGLYAVDVSSFRSQNFVSRIQEKSLNYPKKLLYVGRLLKYKWVVELAQCFSELTDDERNGWILEIVGNGPLNDVLSKYKSDNLKLIPFVQPSALPLIANESGAFCLPSIHENWGVTVQEFAAAGLPLICSDKVGASSTYLIDGYNGFSFFSGSKESLKLILIKFFSQDNKSIVRMAQNSSHLASYFDSTQWAFVLHGFTTGSPKN